jgi:hypothetical protein
MVAWLAASSGRGVDAGADERSTVRGGTARGALRRKRGGDEMGAAASGGAPFKRRAENRGRGGRNGGPTVRTPRGTERAWGLALTGGRRPDRVPVDRGPAAAHAGGAAWFWVGALRGWLTCGPRLAAGEGGRREA